jgi:hypothetical protein
MPCGCVYSLRRCILKKIRVLLAVLALAAVSISLSGCNLLSATVEFTVENESSYELSVTFDSKTETVAIGGEKTWEWESSSGGGSPGYSITTTDASKAASIRSDSGLTGNAGESDKTVTVTDR